MLALLHPSRKKFRGAKAGRRHFQQSSIQTPIQNGERLIGRTFFKNFESHGTFKGTVQKYLRKEKLYSVTYTDGDHEDLNDSEMCALLQPVT